MLVSSIGSFNNSINSFSGGVKTPTPILKRRRPELTQAEKKELDKLREGVLANIKPSEKTPEPEGTRQ